MERTSREGENEKANRIKNQNQNQLKEKESKGKSCKGYLYYSSALKSNGKNPRCIGVPRALPQVSNYIVGQSEVEASKKGRSLVDFYYGCAGYSVYVNNAESTNKSQNQTELPICVGLELLVDRRVTTSDNASTPGHAYSREDRRELPQPRTQKPAHSIGEDFLSRYARNANLVASGVARNVRRVGNYIRETFDDILYPYRRRPK